jgi:hypothetical protein
MSDWVQCHCKFEHAQLDFELAWRPFSGMISKQVKVTGTFVLMHPILPDIFIQISK